MHTLAAFDVNIHIWTRTEGERHHNTLCFPPWQPISRARKPPLAFIGRWACHSDHLDWRRLLCVYISAESLPSEQIRVQSEKRNRLDRISLGECVPFHRHCFKSPASNQNGRQLFGFLTFSIIIYYSKLNWTENNDPRHRSRNDPGGFGRREFRLQTFARPRTLEWRAAPGVQGLSRAGAIRYCS